MIIALVIAGFFILILIVGKINLSFQFRKEVNKLFGQSENISINLFHPEQFYGLPEPVQRDFKYILKEGQP